MKISLSWLKTFLPSEPFPGLYTGNQSTYCHSISRDAKVFEPGEPGHDTCEIDQQPRENLEAIMTGKKATTTTTKTD